MSTLTVSNSGTAWIRDMQAQGKSALGGWANSPDAAYYASLDTDSPLPKPANSTTTAADLKQLKTEFDNLIQADDPHGEQEVQNKINTIANARSLPATGNIINTTA